MDDALKELLDQLQDLNCELNKRADEATALIREVAEMLAVIQPGRMSKVYGDTQLTFATTNTFCISVRGKELSPVLAEPRQVRIWVASHLGDFLQDHILFFRRCIGEER